MPFSRLRKGAFCIILNPRLNEKPGTVHLYWQLMAGGNGDFDAEMWKIRGNDRANHNILWFEDKNRCKRGSFFALFLYLL